MVENKNKNDDFGRWFFRLIVFLLDLYVMEGSVNIDWYILLYFY